MRPDSSAAPRNSRGGDHLVAAPPADQRLGPGDARGRQVHDRLVLQRELAVADGPLQVADDLQPADHVRVHVRGVDLDPVAAGVLGPRHGHVRVAQHEPGRVHVGQRDAHARGQRDLLAGHLERLRGDRADQPLGDLGHLLDVPGVLDQDGELVAAPAGHRVVDRDDGAQPPGGLRQHEVTRAVADRVVDRGEAVQVEEDDAGPPGHRGVTQHVPGALLDVRAVRQPGQPVVEGQVRDLLAQRDLVAHVAGGDEHLDGLTGRLVAQHGGLDVPPRPVGGPDPDREPARIPRPFRPTHPPRARPAPPGSYPPSASRTDASAADRSSGWTKSSSRRPASAPGW